MTTGTRQYEDEQYEDRQYEDGQYEDGHKQYRDRQYDDNSKQEGTIQGTPNVGLLDISIDELKLDLTRNAQNAYRANQIMEWVYKGVASFDDMTNLPLSLRKWLAANYRFPSVEITRKLISESDNTIKYAMLLHDGNILETVLMRYKHGNSVCVSSQVGCKMGCTFCASSGIGFCRNLSIGEIVNQVLAVSNDTGERVSNVVFMGIGEPLDNIENVIAAIKILNDPKGLNIGMRHISLSTCGIIPGIERLAKEKFTITLSVSLHAPNDIIRRQLMPIAGRYTFGDLLESCRKYADITGRRITVEYAMISSLNDRPIHADELARQLGKGLWHVNLIPLNEIPGNKFKASSRENIFKFKDRLETKGIGATIRRSLGDDISASCGQLRRSMMT